MLVLVVGNINSGKSHAVRLIQKILPEYPVLAIDEYRKKYGDGTIEAEVKTRERFVHDAAAHTNAIVELSGMGPLGTMLESIIPHKQFVVVHIEENLEVCLTRLASKDFDSIPYPKYGETLENTIERIDKEIAHGELHKLWEAKNLAFFTVRNDTRLDEAIHEISFRLYEKTAQVIHRLLGMETIREIVVYGSLARKELSLHSDVDMMVSTDLSLQEVEHALARLDGLSFHDTPDGKVTLYFGEWLVEVVVVKQLEENAKYYVNSYIEDIKGSIVKGNENTLHALKLMQDAFHPDVEAMKQETLKRLVFFVRSLPGIARKNDAYKYFFHVNIIIHELVRLERLVKKDLPFLYLPKNVYPNTSIQIKTLTYAFGQDYGRHLSGLIGELDRLFKEFGVNESFRF